MKARRFNIEFPLPDDGRKGQNRLKSSYRGENDPETDRPDILPESFNLPEFDRLKTIDSRIGEINSFEDPGSEVGKLESKDDTDAGEFSDLPGIFSGAERDFDKNSQGDSERVSPEPRLDRIRRKVAEGYYNSPEFIGKLADTLIEKLYLKEGGQ